MDRKEFLLKISLGTAAITCGCLYGCGEDNPSSPNIPPPPSNIDFTIDLDASENSALKNNGGSIYRSGIVIGRINATTFTALSQTCTHQGTTVQFQLSNSRVHCPNHGSNYNLEGGVINGPATSPLRKYNTELNGNMLRVFS